MCASSVIGWMHSVAFYFDAKFVIHDIIWWMCGKVLVTHQKQCIKWNVNIYSSTRNVIEFKPENHLPTQTSRVACTRKNCQVNQQKIKKSIRYSFSTELHTSHSRARRIKSQNNFYSSQPWHFHIWYCRRIFFPLIFDFFL